MCTRKRELAVERRRVADDVRDAGEPDLELALELGGRGELGVVVELEVRDDGDLRRERERRAVRLVGLDDQIAPAEAGVRAELRHRRADQPRGVAPGLAQRERDQRCGRPFAV